MKSACSRSSFDKTAFSRLDRPAEGADAETKLAFGEKINLSTADIFELELLPGISDAMACTIQKNKVEIRRLADSAGIPAGTEVLTVIPRIGPQTAKKLKPYLAIDK